MPEDSEGARGGRDKKDKNSRLSFSGKRERRQAPRPVYSSMPMSYYWFKDVLRQFISNENFPDALAIAFAIISASIAFPFFPLPVLAVLIAVTFTITIYRPLLGFILLLFETLLMFIYQAPLLAWMLAIFISVALFLSYRHYRTITFIYAVMMLSLSNIGSILVLPVFVIGTLYIGFRRAIVSAIVIILMVSMMSGLAGLQPAAPFVYNYQSFSNSVPGNIYSGAYFSPSQQITTITTFVPATVSAFRTLFSYNVAGGVTNSLFISFYAMTHDIVLSILEIFVWILLVFAMTNYVIKSRSPFKGTEASFFSIMVVLFYVGVVYSEGQQLAYAVVIAFVITPLAILLLEMNNVGVAKALDVMKQDFLGKFGEALQDLTSNTKETLNDVANYEETKNELRQAVLSPIEHREISGAYNVKPAKGILLFGPPGTGKTLIMRALANEVRARFYYVQTSTLVTPFQGEGLQTLSKIFNTVRKSPPAILFFDEIDSIAGKREMQESESSRQLLSELLTQMDGFQKIDGVVIVGATNQPDMLDPAILRAGRFDKIISMPLPSKDGRAKIFEYYLKRLPAVKNMSYSRLADMTERYTGADIKNVCNEVARQVADEAVKESKVLEITYEDVARVIKRTKPSISLSSLDKYNQFKLDFERRAMPESKPEAEDKVRLDDVVDLKEPKKALYEAIEIPIVHPELVKKYDVQNVKGILLFGPPGTGKTMLMRAIANEIEDVTLITLSGVDVSKKGIESSLQIINETFLRAKENQPSVIFIDEIDAMLPERENASELSLQITSEFLQNLDGMRRAGNVILVGATNRPDKMDPAILRPGRFDRLIFVGPPSASDRRELFERNLKKAPCEKDIDYGRLAELTSGYTGADIADICRKAKLNALEANISTSSEKRISTSDMVSMINGIRPSAPSEIMGTYLSFLALYKGR